ncbi:MAG: fumarate hydratase [Bacillota bacterium]
MRSVDVGEIAEGIARLAKDSNYRLDRGYVAYLEDALAREDSPDARHILAELLENAEAAAEDEAPLCQDTGVAVVFLEIGQGVALTGGDLRRAVDEGVRRGYREGYLRSSVVRDPLMRENTGDNTPAVLHTEVVPGDRVIVHFLPKGAGSENMSRATMLRPADGREGVVDFVVDTVARAGASACPPLTVGVGLGGTFDMAPLLSKRALLRPLGPENPAKHLAVLERDILRRINELGIGAGGFGGASTALAVHVLAHPCHIASLPVAVNLQCHAHRVGTMRI